MEQAKLVVNSIGHTSGGRCGRDGVDGAAVLLAPRDHLVP